MLYTFWRNRLTPTFWEMKWLVVMVSCLAGVKPLSLVLNLNAGTAMREGLRSLSPVEIVFEIIRAKK